jgi:hypothetical protein
MMTRRSKLALVVVAAISLAVGVVYAERRAIARRWLIAKLAERGAAPSALRVDEIGLRHRSASRGQRKRSRLEVAELDARCHSTACAGRLDGLRVSGVRLRWARSIFPRRRVRGPFSTPRRERFAMWSRSEMQDWRKHLKTACTHTTARCVGFA